MAYLGAQPNKTLTKTTSQSFNGTGSATTFTLNRAVNTGEELEVFVENVQQEPGSSRSYTATGTTLTFDEAPPSGTGNIYVIYRGLAEVTTRLEHDANSALAATTGTFSGAVSGTTGTFTGDLTVDTNTLHVDAANNRVGVGTTSPSNDIEISGTNPTIRLTDTNGTNQYSTISGNAGSVVIKSDQEDSATGSIRFFVGGGEKGRFLEGGGLTFNGDTAAANALDDYEEGSWTPTISNGTIASNFTYYTKIGDFVTVSGNITTFSDRTSTSSVVIGGLPYASKSNNRTVGSALHRYVDDSGEDVVAFVGGSTSNVNIYLAQQSNNWVQLKHNDLMSASAQFYMSFSYRV